MADSLFLSNSDHDTSHDGLLSLLYTEQHLLSITHLLLQQSPSFVAQQQIALAAALISKTCIDEHHRVLLAQGGVLEALALRLASFVVATGCSLNSDNGSGVRPGHDGDIPRATSRSKISPVLEAIAAIVQHSKSRALQFLNATALASVFHKPLSDTALLHERKASGSSPNGSIAPAAHQTPQNAIESLIPSLPSSHLRSSLTHVSNFPPLGALGTSGKQLQATRSFGSAIEIIQSQGLEYMEDEESPLIAWLIYIARSDNEVTGLMAAWVLAILYQQGLAKRGRETAFALLLVPSLVHMLDKDPKISREIPSNYGKCDHEYPDSFIQEKAASILGMLAANSLEVQKAAADAGAIKKLSRLLKESYDEMPPDSATLMWTPEPATSRHPEALDDGSKLGPAGISPEAFNVMRLRGSILSALAAIATDKDDYRKAIIEHGVVPFVIKTLKPEVAGLSSIPQASAPAERALKNTTPFNKICKDTILAACGIARALSRSVSTLRTSLMDAGLPAPLFVLLKHQDTELQVAATAVVINLVLQFSPMREARLQLRYYCITM